MGAVMVAAIATVHKDKGFFAAAGGYEYSLALAVAALATAFDGAGRYSVDHVLGWSLGSRNWGIAAALGALALGTTAASRSVRLPHWRGRHAATA